ncbi:hypothetical protein [Bacillus sp. SM2101]|uniref:hypothetical protein n=1 Tax=Bacillus sp. SM2101 TaxID=2805366 RepID=UPI001BDE0CDD|nr:hypothetical protein [Bacillus sp. SM2101]
MNIKVFMIFTLIFLCLISVNTILASEDSTIAAELTIEVVTANRPSEQQAATPIKGARSIVINSLGEIIATALTNSEGKTTVSIKVPKDPRFPMINMGEVTVISVANGYNEYINFSVSINEHNNKTGKATMRLSEIDPDLRNEPDYIYGNFHRFTVFEMLDYYAEKVGLVKQEINDLSGSTPPWSSQLKN